MRTTATLRHALTVSAAVTMLAGCSSSSIPTAPGTSGQVPTQHASSYPSQTCPGGVDAPTWPDPDNDNLIADGDFVGTPLPTQFFEYGGAIPATNWKIPVGNIDLAGLTEWNGHSGPGADCTVDLDGSVHGAISEKFATVANTVYTVYFQYSGSTVEPIEVNCMRVSAAGQHRLFHWSIDPPGHDVYNGVWKRGSWKFTATGAMTTLEFKSVDPPANPNGGMVVTEILVEAPPG